MATRVSLITRADGSLAVAKVPLSGDRRDRWAEAHWLEQAAAVLPSHEPARRAGVVPLLAAEATPGMPTSSATIITERVIGETLRTTWLAPAGVADALSLVADLLADLHDHDLVHGNLSADHIILDPTGPRLCSPHGAITDPRADAVALGHCLRSVLERWDRLGVEVRHRVEWERLAANLEAGTGSAPLPLRRAARSFERLALAAPTTGAGQPEAIAATRRPWGLLAAGAAGALSLSGLAVAGLVSDTAPSAHTTEIEVQGGRYRLAAPAGPVLVIDDACPHQPDVLVLDDGPGVVWRLDTADPAAGTTDVHQVGSIVAEVPDATTLAIEEGERCPVVVAIGPAGRTIVVGG